MLDNLGGYAFIYLTVSGLLAVACWCFYRYSLRSFRRTVRQERDQQTQRQQVAPWTQTPF